MRLWSSDQDFEAGWLPERRQKGRFELVDKPKPELQEPKDAIVRVILSSICSSDLHIKHGSVPRAVPGITVGHEMVGVVEQVGPEVKTVSPGDRVVINVETFCGECFFCKNGYVNNCTDPDGGWALGCRIDGGQVDVYKMGLITYEPVSHSYVALGETVGKAFSAGNALNL